MTDNVTPHPAQRRHSWPKEGEEGLKRIAYTEFADGNARTEKVCKLCGLVKITVHSPDGTFPREWRRPGEAVNFRADATPVCFGQKPTFREYTEVQAL